MYLDRGRLMGLRQETSEKLTKQTLRIKKMARIGCTARPGTLLAADLGRQYHSPKQLGCRVHVHGLATWSKAGAPLETLTPPSECSPPILTSSRWSVFVPLQTPWLHALSPKHQGALEGNMPLTFAGEGPVKRAPSRSLDEKITRRGTRAGLVPRCSNADQGSGIYAHGPC